MVVGPVGAASAAGGVGVAAGVVGVAFGVTPAERSSFAAGASGPHEARNPIAKTTEKRILNFFFTKCFWIK